MSRSRCSFCRAPDPDGTAAIYAATLYPSGLRLAHRLYLCTGCATETLVPLIKKTPLEREDNDDQACVVCERGTAEDPNYYWWTVYPPHGERTDHESLLCFKCHAMTVEWVSEHGRRLPDREPAARTPQPITAAWAFLAG